VLDRLARLLPPQPRAGEGRQDGHRARGPGELGAGTPARPYAGPGVSGFRRLLVALADHFSSLGVVADGELAAGDGEERVAHQRAAPAAQDGEVARLAVVGSVADQGFDVARRRDNLGRDV